MNNWLVVFVCILVFDIGFVLGCVWHNLKTQEKKVNIYGDEE